MKIRRTLTTRILAAIIALCCTVTICACSGEAAQDKALYTGEYFGDLTNREQAEYIIDIFYSGLAHLKTPKESGLAALSYVYGIQEENQWITFDKITNNGGSNTLYAKEVPVSYSLFQKAQEYEQKKGIDNTDAATRHNKKYAIKAQSVQDVITMVFRKDVPVAHASVDGADYIESEQVYVFDELINPYQSFIDKSWELQYMNYFGDEVYEKGGWGDLNEGILFFFSYIPLWYDQEGNIYDMYGDFIVKQDDPSNRLKNDFDYARATEKAQGNARAYFSTISASPMTSEDNPHNDLDTPIDTIFIGKQPYTR